jgi:hypothetical protein
MKYAACQKCKAAMVERVDDAKGVTGEAVEKPCGGKP